MKANEAPEKIYLQDSMSTDTIGDLWPEWFDAEVSDNSIEYTRTDAFVEKALKFLDGCIPDYIDLKHANVDTFMDVDNERFIKDFINHIKGE